MDAKTIYLKSEAMKLNACNEGVCTLIDKMSDDELCGLYLRFYDFCVDNKFPDKDFVKNNFDRHTLLANNIFVDEVGVITPESSHIFVRGNSDITMECDNFGVYTVIVCENAKVEINAKGRSIVFVKAYDESNVNVSQSGASKVTIKRKSEKSVIETSGTIQLI